MKSPPSMLLLENVVGFENSATRQALSEVLIESGYHFQEFILSPTNFGTPYSRPRYFGLARRQQFAMEKLFSAPWTCTPQHILQNVSQGQKSSACSPKVCLCISFLRAPELCHYRSVNVNAQELTAYNLHPANTVAALKSVMCCDA